jgi:RNA polymerase sigma-70 factor (ECF subfamily)
MRRVSLEYGSQEDVKPPVGREVFVTTRWTVVLKAGNANDSAVAKAALGELCQTYWFPLYAYVRRRGLSSHDAEDRVQGFLARLIRLNSVAELSREKGRFRAFLLAGLKHYLADEWDRESAAKRDVRRTLSWDALEAESRYAAELADRLTPERLYERQWALALLESVVRRLRGEYEAAGKGDLYAALQVAVTGGAGAVAYAELSLRLGQSEGALRVAVHRLRQRYRQVLREEIGHTVEREDEVDSELADLRRVLSEHG